MSRQLARRRQRERAGGIVLATIGVAVLVVAIIALRKPNGNGAAGGKPTTPKASASTSASTSAHSTAPSSPHATKPAAAKLPLVVLNDTGTSGVGEQAAARFEQGGWQVTSSSDYQNDILSTCAYYDPADPRAQAAAQALQRQFPTIKRVVAKFPELPAGPIVVVLTPDYTSG